MWWDQGIPGFPFEPIRFRECPWLWMYMIWASNSPDRFPLSAKHVSGAESSSPKWLSFHRWTALVVKHEEDMLVEISYGCTPKSSKIDHFNIETHGFEYPPILILRNHIATTILNKNITHTRCIYSFEYGNGKSPVGIGTSSTTVYHLQLFCCYRRMKFGI